MAPLMCSAAGCCRAWHAAVARLPCTAAKPVTVQTQSRMQRSAVSLRLLARSVERPLGLCNVVGSTALSAWTPPVLSAAMHHNRAPGQFRTLAVSSLVPQIGAAIVSGCAAPHFTCLIVTTYEVSMTCAYCLLLSPCRGMDQGGAAMAAAAAAAPSPSSGSSNRHQL
jgi:hypothetical protein